MRTKAMNSTAAIAIVGVLFGGTAHAFNFGNMMNPSRWMGGNNSDRYDDYYDGPGYYGGGPGYYGGGPGYYGGGPGYYGGGPDYYGGTPGYGAAPGYGATPGYGADPGYGNPAGYAGTPGYSMDPAYGGTPGYSAPESGSSSDKAEIARLKARIKKLEEGSR